MTEVTVISAFGLETTSTGLADAPSKATISKEGCKIIVTLSADAGNPLIVGAPHIKYFYRFTFDLKKGELLVSGSHSAFPWHKVNTSKGKVENFSPKTGATPTSLFKSPTPIKPVTQNIKKYTCCEN